MILEDLTLPPFVRWLQLSRAMLLIDSYPYIDIPTFVTANYIMTGKLCVVTVGRRLVPRCGSVRHLKHIHGNTDDNIPRVVLLSQRILTD